MGSKILISPDLGANVVQTCILPHPSSGELSMYLVNDKDSSTSFSELLSINDEYSSWFVGNRVVQDGNIYLASPIDPLFIVLSAVTAVCPEEQGTFPFFAIDQILTHMELPDLEALKHPDIIERFEALCNTQSIAQGAIILYQLDATKVLAFLTNKLDTAAQSLKDLPKLSMSLGLHAKASTSDTNLAALRTLSDYLHPFWLDALVESLQLKKQWTTLHTPASLQPVKTPADFARSSNFHNNSNNNGIPQPAEDYSLGENNHAASKKQKFNLATIDKKIKDKDVRNVNKLSSFFAVKK